MKAKSGTMRVERVIAVRSARMPIMASWKTRRPTIMREQIMGQARPVLCCVWSIA